MAARSSWQRRLVAVVGFLLLLPPILVLNLWGFLRSPWGARVLAGQVEQRLSEVIDGTIRIGEVGTFGTLGFRLETVIVLDPTGAPTIAVRDLRVKVSPWALLGGELVGDVSIAGGRVSIVELAEYDDVNIGAAFQPEDPAPEQPEPEREGPPPPLPPDPPLPIRLERLHVEDTAFLFAEAPGAKPQVLVRDIEARAAGWWNDRGAGAELDLLARAVEPVRAPLALEVEGAFAQNWLDALRLDVVLGDSEFHVKGRGEMRALEGRLIVDGEIASEQARALEIPLASDLAIDGDFWIARDRSSVALRLSTGEEGGVVAIDGWYDRPDGNLFAQTILAGVDPAAWVVDAPQGRIAGSARAVGTLLPSPDLRVELLLQPGALIGREVGPAAIAGVLRGETLHLDPSWLQLPGATFRVEGNASAQALDLEGRLDASDLGAASRFVADLLGEERPPLDGRGTLRFDVAGSPADPTVGADLDFSRLAWGPNEARGLDLQGRGSIGDDGLPVGSLAGTADRLRTGRLDARRLQLEAERRDNGDFSLDARARSRAVETRELGATRLRVEGRLEQERVTIDEFRFEYPEGSLRSEGGAVAEFGDGAISLEGFALEQGGGGSLRARGSITARRLDIELEGEDLQLERLPQALLPENLSGTVDLEAQLQGTATAPEGRVVFRLREGVYGRLRDFAATGDVRLEDGRAAGQVEAALGGTGLLVGRYAGPIDPMNAPAAAPIDLELRVGPLELAGLGSALETELPSGTVRARISGKGTVGVPDVDVEVLLSDLEIPDAPELPPLAAHLTGTLHEGRATVDLEAWAADRRVLELRGGAPLDPRRFRRAPEAEIDRMLRSGDSRAQGVVRGLDLELVGALIDQPDLAGAVVAEFDVRGPIVDPRGVVRLEARGGPVGPVRRLSIASLVELLPDRSRLVAGVAIDGQRPAEIRAEVGAPPRAFIDGTAPPSTPAELVIEVPDLDLGGLGGRAATAAATNLVAGASGGRGLAGTVAARGRFRGTLADLPGELRIIGQDIVFRGVPLGGAELAVVQTDRLDARLSAIDATAGTLVATARLDGAVSPLGLAQEGIELFRRMQALVEVRGTDLSLLPLAVVSTINRVGGKVDFEARGSGPLLELDPVGTIAVRGGYVELVGGPRYQAITVDAQLTGERLALARLTAEAPGRGRLVADGRLQRTSGPDPFSFEVSADSFPIGGPGGVSARVSAEGQLEGTFHPREGLFATLEVPRARIELPRSPPRELQEVSRLRDVVIVTGPEAFLRQRRLRAAASEGALPLELRLDAPRRIFVTGEDVDAELGAELVIRRPESGDVLADGEVRARRGRVRVLGRSFVLEEAAALWGGGPIENPQLSLTARYQARDATAWVDVTGWASAPEIGLRSDPPLPESQVALLIAAGRTSLPGQTDPFGEPVDGGEIDPAGAAASVAGSFAAQRLRSALGPRLPLDVLTLETVGTGTRLEAGTYVSERLYLGYLRNFLPEQDENANEVRAEYELSRTVALESRFGDRGAAGVDLVWEKRIATPAQQRARRAAYEDRVGRPPDVEPTEIIGPEQDEEPLDPGEDAPAALESDPARREDEDESE
ncbi:translocation/assembly module TamB domain-containing protein [Vulgatibacter sp.]|uniref:translocation/assembly module TamB domain-containing protein n=1 Tax=Vulgatibacter sp. TaxID=1971226 RepID=UPI00356B1332